VAGTVEASVDRIVAWLREHAPATAATLRPPAPAEALDAAEREVGAAFPADLRAWYARTDGMQWIFPWAGTLIPSFYRPYPLAMALDIRRMMLEVAAQFPPEWPLSAVAGEASQIWQPSFMPIAADTGGVTVFVDLREGPLRGCVLEYDKVSACHGVPAWPSVSAMLAEVAGALVHDRLANGCRREVDAQGRLTWRYPEGLWPDRGLLHIGELARTLAELVGHATAGDHSDPARAALITARSARVVDALLATGVALGAGQPARYDDPDPRDDEALRAYLAQHGGLPGLAQHLAGAGERLLAICAPYHEEYGTPHRSGRPPRVPATVRERGDIVIDGVLSWPGLLAGLSWLLHSASRALAALRPRQTLRANRASSHFRR
jgi:cell wall assembly regulator SMI1